MKKELQIYTIEFKKDDSLITKAQPAYGKTDLFNCLREMMKDGFTQFKIITHKKQF